MRAFLGKVSICWTTVGLVLSGSIGLGTAAYADPTSAALTGTYHPSRDLSPNVVHVVTEVVYARGPYGQQRLHRLMKDQNFSCQNMGEALFRCIHQEQINQVPDVIAESMQNRFNDLEVQFASSQGSADAASLEDGWVTPQLVSIQGEAFDGFIFHQAHEHSQVAFKKATETTGQSFVLDANGTLKWQIQASTSTRRSAQGFPRTDAYFVYVPLTEN